MKNAIVDVCHTLYDSNTTFSFIDYVVIKKNKTNVLLKNGLLKRIIILLGMCTRKDLYRYMYIRNLKGLSQSELRILAHDYYNEYLQNKKIKQVFDVIKEGQSQYKYTLCSASLDVIIEAIVHHNPIFQDEFYSSTLEFNSGICTGKLQTDLLGAKHELFEQIDWLLTDNKSDLELAKKSSKTTVVAKNKNVSFWRNHGFKVDIKL